MIPRLGDGNNILSHQTVVAIRLENDSPFRGRKRNVTLDHICGYFPGLENDSPFRGRKRL